jgi:hypothetical protein
LCFTENRCTANGALLAPIHVAFLGNGPPSKTPLAPIKGQVYQSVNNFLYLMHRGLSLRMALRIGNQRTADATIEKGATQKEIDNLWQ